MIATRINHRLLSPKISSFLEKLNGAGHEKALWVYMAIVIAHWLEHLMQAYQIWVLGMARPESLGLVGKWYPWLVTSELMHWSYAVSMFIGLVILLPGFYGRSRLWWMISLLIQGWHLFEHSLLQGQAMIGDFLFGASIPMSVFQYWIPRVELHLIYNAAVFIPMMVAMYYHLYPPAGEPAPACGCARGVCELPNKDVSH